MVAIPSWPGLSGPSPPARAATGGPDKPGHDAEATGGPILTPMRACPGYPPPTVEAQMAGAALHSYQDKATAGGGFGGTGRCLTVMARLVRAICCGTCRWRWSGRAGL